MSQAPMRSKRISSENADKNVSPSSAAHALQMALVTIGFDAPFVSSPELAEDEVGIIVGERR
jgi:hypothetical protein